MILYADSSSVLAWVLGQENGDAALEAFTRASRVFCSELTLFECDRVLRSREGTLAMAASEVGMARSTLKSGVQTWATVPLSEEVLRHARRSFPREPVRSLDAIHLGTAMFLRDGLPDLIVVTLDRRFAENAALLGFRVLPEEKPAPGG